MGDAIGQMLPAAVGIAISPFPIVAVVLLLVTERARSNGLAFLLGAVLGVLIVGGLFLVLASSLQASEDSQPANWVSWLMLVLGLLLILLTVRQWQSRPSDETPEEPKWMESLDTFTPVKSLGLGMLLAGVNPKNLLLIIAGAASIAGTGISSSEQVIALLVFVLISSIGVATPVVIYFLLGTRSGSILQGLKEWMVRNNAVVMAILLLIIGVKLIGDAISGLS